MDEIHLVHTEFVSMLTQRPVIRRILPLEIEETTEAPPSGPLPLYEFEPSPEDVLNALLPWYVESRIFARAARLGRRRDRGEAPGDEVGHGQRQRAARSAHP